MITQVLHCPYCQGTDIVRHGTTPEGKQRYRCRACPDRGRTFLLDYSYPGQSQHVKHQIVEMAMNASGIRDTARVLHVSPTTVIKELKKRTAPATGESGRVVAVTARAGRGGHLLQGGARPAGRPGHRTRWDVELCGQESGPAVVVAGDRSPQWEGIGIRFWETKG